MKKSCCALLIFVSSCAGFDALEIVSHSPASGEYGVAADATVRIEFSADVKKETVEQNFSLASGSTPISGTFRWEGGRIFFFTPNHTFENGSRCVMQIPKSVEDTRGNSMEKDFICEFYVGTDLTSPKVISSNPPYAEGGNIGIPADIQQIDIIFSEPMDTIAASSAFTISPDVAGYIFWNDDSTRLFYRLTGKLEHGKQYRVSVSTSAKDTSGNPLEKTYTLVFIAGEDFIHPEVRGAYETGSTPPPYFETENINRHISRFSSISVEFSESMNTQSAESAFSLTPSTAGRFIWSGGNAVLTFVPEQPLEMDTVYTLRVSTTAKDAAGLSLQNEYSALFRTDASDSLPFSISYIEGSYDASVQRETLYDGTALPWPIYIHMGPIDGTNPNPNDYIMNFYFANAEGPVAIDFYSFIESILVELLDGEGSPCITDIEMSDDGTSAILTFDGLINIRNPETPETALYRLTIAGGSAGLKDIHGNTMKKSFVVEFKDSL